MDNQQSPSRIETNNLEASSAISEPPKQKRKVLPLVIAIVLAVGVGFAAAYLWQQSKIDELSAQLSATESKVAELNAQVTELSATPKDGGTETNQAEYFEIKQLGVKFETNPSLKDLYYSIGNQGKTAYFSLTGLKDTDCAAEKVSPMALTRYTTEDLASDPAAAVIKKDSKKIGEYYFFIAGGQAQCSDTEDEAAEVSALKQEISKILPDNLEAISE